MDALRAAWVANLLLLVALIVTSFRTFHACVCEHCERRTKVSLGKQGCPASICWRRELTC